MFFALFLAIINTFVLIEFGNYLASFFNPDIEIVNLAATLLIIAAIFQIADGLNFAGVGALRGLKILRFYSFLCLSLIGLLECQ